MRTVGVEEEFMLVSPDGTLRPVAPAVLRYAKRVEDPSTDVPGGHLEKELMQEQIETSTHPCADLDELAREVRAGRTAADGSARRAGARLAAVGTAPGTLDTSVFVDERLRRVHEAFGPLVDEAVTCGCHVHVEVADDDEGVLVADHVRPWASVLLALSTNSPFWAGQDTGYSSYRSQVWGHWPTAGPTAPFGDAATYRRVVADLVASRTILDEGMVYFDARLSARYPTVEVRVADVCLDAEDAVLQAALVRGLAETAVARGDAGPQPRTELLRVAAWRAARTGLRGDLVDPLSGRPAPAATVVRTLLEHVTPALRRTGDLDRVAARLEVLLADGTGADVQRAWRHEGLSDADLLARAAERTLA
ncbi:glutamate--cysteine ligase [Cellulomonas sp. ATA003]|uniref:carboxylate-amine ligase n=1 Tax=Cellulomonas sp. ATA003 TaxID=3073064 RepID=UPI002873E313|nr:glutamate--cysteine ligase [Cellulomonas sp. ATA003]WNB84281.1 glutamate--cysteine ligase [Cellulomonas sp. ATA003]